jgi:hypothetical protein
VASQYSPHASDKFADFEGFHQIVIGTEIKSSNPIFKRVTGGDD